ncbi:Activity-regulated cytoskeleton associated protein 1 [Anthophora plagiata]
MAAVQLTEEQFQQLMAILTTSQRATRTGGSFANCKAHFNGERNREKVEEFITTTTVYKKIEKISDVNALKDSAYSWKTNPQRDGEGVKDGVTSWKRATELLQSAFAPRKPAYQIYGDIFATKQREETPTDVFVAQKRELISCLPHERTEEIQLHMIYSLLRLKIRERIPRSTVKTFDDLIGQARILEELEQETRQRNKPTAAATATAESRKPDGKPRCSSCNWKGHTADECRKRTNAKPAINGQVNGVITCYGCGKPGYVRAKCPNCNKTVSASTGEPSFCALSTHGPRHRPLVDLTIGKQHEVAFFNTGAKTCVASESLYKVL